MEANSKIKMIKQTFFSLFLMFITKAIKRAEENFSIRKVLSKKRGKGSAFDSFKITRCSNLYSFGSRKVGSSSVLVSDRSIKGQMADQVDPENAEQILGFYKQMQSECSQILGKISELNLEKDEHKLVVDTLKKMDSDRRAYRLVGGVLVERTVGDILPIVQSNYNGITEVVTKLDAGLKKKDEERKAFKEKHGIMTQEERDNAMKKKVREAEAAAAALKAESQKKKALE